MRERAGQLRRASGGGSNSARGSRRRAPSGRFHLRTRGSRAGPPDGDRDGHPGQAARALPRRCSCLLLTVILVLHDLKKKKLLGRERPAWIVGSSENRLISHTLAAELHCPVDLTNKQLSEAPEPGNVPAVSGARVRVPWEKEKKKKVGGHRASGRGRAALEPVRVEFGRNFPG